MRAVAALLLLAAGCGADVEPGTYEVTRATDQDTGADLPLVGAQFQVTVSDDGIRIDSLPVGPVSDFPQDGDSYRYEHYSANINQCEAGGTEHCHYSYESTVVTAPSAGRLDITECFRDKRTNCVSSATCGDPTTMLDEGIPCDLPMKIEAKLVVTP